MNPNDNPFSTGDDKLVEIYKNMKSVSEAVKVRASVTSREKFSLDDPAILAVQKSKTYKALKAIAQNLKEPIDVEYDGVYYTMTTNAWIKSEAAGKRKLKTLANIMLKNGAYQDAIDELLDNRGRDVNVTFMAKDYHIMVQVSRSRFGFILKFQ